MTEYPCHESHEYISFATSANLKYIVSLGSIH